MTWNKYYFKYLEPLDGELDNDFPSAELAFGWLKRARYILRDFSEEELQGVIDWLDWIMTSGNERQTINGQEKQLGQGQTSSNEEWSPELEATQEHELVPGVGFGKFLEPYYSQWQEKRKTMPPYPPHEHLSIDVLDLVEKKHDIDISSIRGVKPIKWSHMFAIYGINRIADAICEDKYYSKEDRQIRNKARKKDKSKGFAVANAVARRSSISQHFIEGAIDLLSYAEIEAALEFTCTSSDTQSGKNIAGEELAVKRHAEGTNLKFLFFERYEALKSEIPDISKSKGVDIFLEENPNEITKLGWKDPKRVLLEALYKHQKKTAGK